jgi:large subunit ribosomal protein L18
LIDDDAAVTIAAASSRDKDIAAQTGTKVKKGKMVGEAIARKAKDLGIETVTFDRGGYLYHGRVKQLLTVQGKVVWYSKTAMSH